MDGTVQYCAYCGAAKDHQATSTEAQDADGKEKQSLLTRGVTRFAPSGRQGRLAFFLNVLAIWVGLFVIAAIIAVIYFWNNPYALDDSLENNIGLFTIPGYLLTAFQMVKRLHDFGRPAWHLLAFLIPIWSLYEWGKLIFGSGDEVLNDYGPYP
jgi:uncharacterized membrane protein YhaH (DUF805 family)